MTPRNYAARRLRLAAVPLALSRLAIGCSIAPGVAAAQDKVANLAATDVFALADRLRTAGQMADAVALYDALADDPDRDVRSEARFRKGMMLADAKRYAEAAVAFRALLDEKPDAAGVRLELARVLAEMGDERGARRSLRQAQAAGLPSDVALVVDQFANALRSSKRLGGSLEVALAPDSNINRATAARTLDTIIAPLTLSRDARAQSGLGLKIAGQAFGRIEVGDRLSLLPRISTRANLYRARAFDDISASALVGLEWQGRRDRITPSVGPTWRWYGGELYARTQTVGLDWLHPIGRRAQLTTSGSASRARYVRNDLQDGGIYDATISIERATGASGGIGGAVSATRQTARDAGYATIAGGGTLSGWREIGRTTLFASAGLRRTEGDERLFLFPDRRREWLYQASIGTTLRQFTLHGFAPIIRFGYERNVSTVGLYDYRRVSTDVGITRAF